MMILDIEIRGLHCPYNIPSELMTMIIPKLNPCWRYVSDIITSLQKQKVNKIVSFVVERIEYKKKGSGMIEDQFFFPTLFLNSKLTNILL